MSQHVTPFLPLASVQVKEQTMASSKGTNKKDNKVQGSGGDQGGSKAGQGKKAEGRKSGANKPGGV